MGNSEKSILKTLLYSDIFDYPLTKDEVFRFLISNKNINENEFDKKIKSINSVVFRKDGFLYMEGKKPIISIRQKWFHESTKKIEIAEKIAQKLFNIPTVLFIGISGNLSMMAADKDDDIDFFIIAQKNKTYLTRFLLILYLKILGKHRKRGDKKISNKICLNMIIDESKLALPRSFRNLYTAHEIAQLKPLVERNKTYDRFIKANEWIKKYLPNALLALQDRILFSEKVLFQKLLSMILGLPMLEETARFIQRLLIKRNLTREVIEDNFIALHPKDYKSIILSRYSKKLSQYGL